LRVLRRIFGPKENKAAGESRKLHNEEVNVLYSSSNIVQVMKSRKMRWAGHVARMGERRGVYRVLVGKPERKRPLGIPRIRWEDNIKMDLRKVGCGGMDWIELSQGKGQVARTCKCGNESSGSIKFGEFLDYYLD
jgi:hypothetical protein